MNGLQNDWYVAGPDGEAIGPLARIDLARRHAAGTLPRDALAWHVDHAEWLPLSRALSGLSSLTAGPGAAPPARPPAQTAQAKAPPKPARGDGAPAKKPPSDDRAIRDARESRQVQALRERLAASTAAAGASIERARAAAGDTAGRAKVDAVQSGLRLQQGVRRVLARAIDVLLVGVPVAAIGWALFAQGDGGLPAEAPAAPFLAWVSLFVLVPLETAMLALAGTTPGKALLGLRVTGPGGKPDFGAAWGRARTVVWRGVGLGIVPLTIIAVIVAGVQLVNDGEAPWDRAQGLSMRAEAMENARWQWAFAAVVGGLFLLAGGLWGEIAVDLATVVAGQ